MSAGEESSAPAPAPRPDESVAAFLRLQVATLEPFEYITVGPPGPPFAVVQIGRTPQGTFEVGVPPQQGGSSIEGVARARLIELGFTSLAPTDPAVPWILAVSEPDGALVTAISVMSEVLGGDLRTSLDVLHGSSRELHEAQQRLEQLRQRIEPMLGELSGHPPHLDADGDYALRIGEVSVIVVPRAVPDSMTLVRVVAVTNSEVTIGPDLGLFLARLNFGLMFGRFALDVEHRAIWFDETLLGEGLSAEQLRFTVEMVARTTVEWRVRLQQMFGGKLSEMDLHGREMVSDAPPRPKPGASGYL